MLKIAVATCSCLGSSMLDSYLIHEDVNIIYTNDLGNEGTKREKNGHKLWCHLIKCTVNNNVNQ